MKGEHFHEEWSFRVVFTKDGKQVRETRYDRHDWSPFQTEEEARKHMHLIVGVLTEMLEKGGGVGELAGEAFDAYEVCSPVRRIVTEWEDQ